MQYNQGFYKQLADANPDLFRFEKMHYNERIITRICELRGTTDPTVLMDGISDIMDPMTHDVTGTNQGWYTSTQLIDAPDMLHPTTGMGTDCCRCQLCTYCRVNDGGLGLKKLFYVFVRNEQTGRWTILPVGSQCIIHYIGVLNKHTKKRHRVTQTDLQKRVDAYSTYNKRTFNGHDFMVNRFSIETYHLGNLVKLNTHLFDYTPDTDTLVPSTQLPGAAPLPIIEITTPSGTRVLYYTSSDVVGGSSNPYWSTIKLLSAAYRLHLRNIREQNAADQARTDKRIARQIKEILQ